jgi:hypothetical protein
MADADGDPALMAPLYFRLAWQAVIEGQAMYEQAVLMTGGPGNLVASLPGGWEQIRTMIETTPFQYEDQTCHLTVSMGIASTTGATSTGSSLGGSSRRTRRPGLRWRTAASPDSSARASSSTRGKGASSTWPRPSARTIVEFGPGTGAFTREISARLMPGRRYLGIELNPDVVRAHLAQGETWWG